jgi:CRISPR-associated protein Cmr3
MLIGLSEELVPEYLDPEGLLHLGGEQRLVQYRLRTEKVPLPPMSTGWALALAPVEFDLLRQMDLINRPRASGSILRMAGWDMKNSFHKPVKAYLPAGSVIEASDRLDTLPFGFIGI